MADIVTNFTEASEQIVIDLINNDNSSALTEALITFGLPTTTTGTSPARNTQVTITAVAGSGYTGSVTVQYNRVDLSTLPTINTSAQTVFSLGDAVNISDLIDEINTAFGINLSNANTQNPDFVDGPLPTFTGGIANEEHPFNVVADENSLVWINQMTLTVQANDIALSTVVTNLVLNGLTYLAPPAPSPTPTPTPS
jgi:hypothetical protein